MSATAHAEEWQLARMRQRRSIVAVGGTFILAFLLRAILENVPLGGLIVLTAWSVTMVVGGLSLGRVSLRAGRWIQRFLGALCAACFAVICSMTGGPQSAYLIWIAAVPWGMVALMQEEVWAVACCAATLLVATVGLFWIRHVPLYETVMHHGLGILINGLLTTYAAWRFRRSAQREAAESSAKEKAYAELAASEAKQAHSERLAIVGRLAAGVAHEINNPLAAVKANVNYLASGRASTAEERQQVLEEAQLGVMRIEQIVTDLKVFSRAEATDSDAERCSVEEVCREALRMAAARLGERVSVDQRFGQTTAQVRVVRRKLSQVVLNLVINSIDAMEASPGARIELSTRQDGDRVILEIQDNGPGFSKEVLNRLFEPFFTTKPPGKGTGLGLALSAEYVRAFGGELTAENRAEGGARLVVRIPAYDAAGARP